MRLPKRHGATSVAEFRGKRGYLPEPSSITLPCSDGRRARTREIVPAAEMARRFDLATVSHGAAVFDAPRTRVDESPLLEGSRLSSSRASHCRVRAARAVTRRSDGAMQFVEALPPVAVGSVDRVEEYADRLTGL
jgi:hypothetical protein